jgi:hypothetical protein
MCYYWNVIIECSLLLLLSFSNSINVDASMDDGCYLGLKLAENSMFKCVDIDECADQAVDNKSCNQLNILFNR